MKVNRRWIQIIVFSMILMIGTITIVNNIISSKDSKDLQVGERPPAFSLLGLDGNMHELAAYSNKLILINFWGTFCPPCRNEMPALQRQYEKWNPQGVEFIAISVDKNKVTVENFINELNIKFPILLDLKETVRMQYGILYYPTTFFVLPNGKVAHKQIGEMNEAFIDQTIQSLLSDELDK